MPPIDERELKRAFGAFPTGVTAVSVNDAVGTPRGMTANAFSAVSLEPPQILVCVNRSAITHALIVECGRFGVNVLSLLTEGISQHCARPGSDKHLDRTWLAAEGASPHLRDAVAFVDCRVSSLYEAGTHSIVVGAVDFVAVHDREPLVYYRGVPPVGRECSHLVRIERASSSHAVP